MFFFALYLLSRNENIEAGCTHVCECVFLPRVAAGGAKLLLFISYLSFELLCIVYIVILILGAGNCGAGLNLAAGHVLERHVVQEV
jgi:hypothetical protein